MHRWHINGTHISTTTTTTTANDTRKPAAARQTHTNAFHDVRGHFNFDTSAQTRVRGAHKTHETSDGKCNANGLVSLAPRRDGGGGDGAGGVCVVCPLACLLAMNIHACTLSDVSVDGSAELVVFVHICAM